MKPELGGTKRGVFFATKDKLQTQCREENLLKEVVKLERIPAAKPSNQCKNCRFPGRSQERFDRLAETMRKSCKASTRSQIGLGLADTLSETDENNSLQVKRQVTL